MLATKNQNTVIAHDVNVMSGEEAFGTFDRAARRYLNMSGQDFLKKWNAGFFKGKRELSQKVDAVSILLPLVER